LRRGGKDRTTSTHNKEAHLATFSLPKSSIIRGIEWLGERFDEGLAIGARYLHQLLRGRHERQ
jgi:hypothetical protein